MASKYQVGEVLVAELWDEREKAILSKGIVCIAHTNAEGGMLAYIPAEDELVEIDEADVQMTLRPTNPYVTEAIRALWEMAEKQASATSDMSAADYIKAIEDDRHCTCGDEYEPYLEGGEVHYPPLHCPVHDDPRYMDDVPF